MQHLASYVLLLGAMAAAFPAMDEPDDTDTALPPTTTVWTSSPESDATSHQKVIYEADDRKDVCAFPENDPMATIARQAVVALLYDSTLGSPDYTGSYTNKLSNYRPIGSRRNLCSDQKFRSQPTAATCSGTLIAPDRVLTAGHCISNSNCGRRRFVFDYFLDGSNCQMPTITADDVYHCKRFTRIENDYFDHAVIHLDRPVVGRTPVQIQTTQAALPVGQHLNVIGFGSGLPAKIDKGGNVIDPRASRKDYFVANTDTFGGNSGSGVFTDDGTLVGILVRGQTDYVTRSGCRRVNTIGCTDTLCSKLNDAEEISYAFRAYLENPDCKSSNDCPNSKSCKRECAADSSECTGWCE